MEGADFPALIPDDEEDDEDYKYPPQSSKGLQASRSCPDNNDSPFFLALDQFRKRHGMCVQCGLQTHHVVERDSGITTTHHVPLTIRNEVHRGRCILCFPLPMELMAQHESMCHAAAANANAMDTIVSCPNSSLAGGGTTSASTNLMETTTAQLLGGGTSMDLVWHRLDVNTIIELMKQFPGEVSVQQLGCQELWVRSWDGDENDDDVDENDTSFRILHLGGIDVILNVMMCFAHNVVLQRLACGALQNLACSTLGTRMIVERGGASLIVQAMLRHARSYSIQEGGCSALVALGAFGGCSAIQEAGGRFALIRSMSSYPSEKMLQHDALQALLMLQQFELKCRNL